MCAWCMHAPKNRTSRPPRSVAPAAAAQRSSPAPGTQSAALSARTTRRACLLPAGNTPPPPSDARPGLPAAIRIPGLGSPTREPPGAASKRCHLPGSTPPTRPERRSGQASSPRVKEAVHEALASHRHQGAGGRILRALAPAARPDGACGLRSQRPQARILSGAPIGFRMETKGDQGCRTIINPLREPRAQSR